MPNAVPPSAMRRDVRSRIERAGLPPHHRVHWSDARKADVVKAVRDQLITFDEARWNYLLSRSEFESWQRQFAKETDRLRELELG